MRDDGFMETLLENILCMMLRIENYINKMSSIYVVAAFVQPVCTRLQLIPFGC